MLNKAATDIVGFANFHFLFGCETFWMVVRQSCLFALTAVFFKSLIGLVCAHLMHSPPTPGQRLWRGLSLLPWVMPPALSTLGWWWLFDPTHGAINWLIELFGGPRVPWLADVAWARVSVILANVWYGAPFFLIMFLAALKSILEELCDAARIDGASAWQRLIYVTLAMMRYAITVLFSIIVTFADFDIVQMLTHGGPRNSTHLFGAYAFQVGIGGGDVPLGAVVSLFMFPILAPLAIFVLRDARARTNQRSRW